MGNYTVHLCKAVGQITKKQINIFLFERQKKENTFSQSCLPAMSLTFMFWQEAELLTFFLSNQCILIEKAMACSKTRFHSFIEFMQLFHCIIYQLISYEIFSGKLKHTQDNMINFQSTEFPFLGFWQFYVLKLSSVKVQTRDCLSSTDISRNELWNSKTCCMRNSR